MSKKIVLLGLALLAISTGSFGDAGKHDPRSTTAYEVRFLSVDLRSDGLGTVVARPCDKSVGCDLLYARIDKKTIFSQNNQALTSREAKHIKWQSGMLAINDNGAAVSVKLFGRSR